MIFLSNKKYNELVARIDAIDSEVRVAPNATSLLQEGNENELSSLGSDEKRKVAYALNLCTVSISQIVDYNDVYVMEQEYDAILNNLNLQNFVKDEALLKVLKQILDTVTFFKILEGDKKFIEKEYQHKMKNAIWSAVPNLSVILAGGNPVQMAITASMQVGVGYMNYRKNKSQYILEKDKQEWELQRSAMEQFNGLRRELFETAWRLSDTYGFDDVFRLTEKQISHYNAILSDSDPLRRFEKLEAISKVFEAFPPFWYFKGNAAREIMRDNEYGEKIQCEYKQKALEAFRKFDEVYVEFMREDVLAASCSLEHISLLDPKTDSDEIKKLLKRATDLAGDNFDVLQICVPIYGALNEMDKASAILRRLVNEEYNVSLNGLLLSRIYCKNGNQTDYDILKKRIGESNVMPMIESNEEAEKKYIELRKEDVARRFNLFIEALAGKYKNQLGYGLEWTCKGLPGKIDHFYSNNLIYSIIDSLNQLFFETEEISFLNNSEKYGLQLPNEEVLTNIKDSIDKLLEDFCEKESAVRDYIKKCDHIHRTRKNHEENVEMVRTIETLRDGIGALYLAFSNGYKKRFEESLTIKAFESSDAIIGEMDRWYTKNNLRIPKKQETNIKTTLAIESRKFFHYDDYKG